MTKNKDFFQLVCEVTQQIPPGRVTSYGAIARFLGSPQSSRMVGWALNATKSGMPYIPAHRVVNRNGMLTGKKHFGTSSAMAQLLQNEGVKIEENQIQNFKNIFWDPSLELI